MASGVELYSRDFCGAGCGGRPCVSSAGGGSSLGMFWSWDVHERSGISFQMLLLHGPDWRTPSDAFRLPPGLVLGRAAPSTVPQKTGLSTRGLVHDCVSPGRVIGFAFGRSTGSSFKFWQLWCKSDSLSVSGRAELPSAGRIAVPGTNSARVGFRARWACSRLRSNMDMFRSCDHSRQVTFTAIQETKFWIA